MSASTLSQATEHVIPPYAVSGAQTEESSECELLGVFGIFIQFLLATICIGSLVIKKFLPGETRSWKIFCFDIWKQFITAGFAHFLNMVLAVYLQHITGEGNGCVWYLVTMLLDCTLGTFFAYLLFKVVDEIAIKFGIEALKSGVYTEKNVPVDATDEIDPDEYVDVRIWLIQVIVWVLCTFIAKIVVFFFQLQYHHELA